MKLAPIADRVAAGIEAPVVVSSYVDGRCHNAQRGTYGHECGKPAVWVGRKFVFESYLWGQKFVFESGFCDDCRHHGDEAKAFSDWRPF